jgi:TfoX/Sxy family transcriptional regulator of competence genes
VDLYEKSSDDTLKIFDELLKNIDCEKRKMFGQLSVFINNNWFAGVFGNRIYCKLEENEQKEFKKIDKGIKTFEPSKEQKMKEFVEMKGTKENILVLRDLIVKSEHYVRSLPKKVHKNKHI